MCPFWFEQKRIKEKRPKPIVSVDLSHMLLNDLHVRLRCDHLSVCEYSLSYRFGGLCVQQSIEVQDFSLGTAPPVLTNIFWTTEAGVVSVALLFCGLMFSALQGIEFERIACFTCTSVPLAPGLKDLAPVG